MKTPNNTLQHLCFIVLAFAGPAANSAQAATLTWNNAGATDNWSTAPGDENWNPGATAWIDGSSAVFSATPETVTVTTSNIVDDITFNGSWMIANGGGSPGITLTTDGNSDITVGTGFNSTIAETIAGTNAVTKLGLGTLSLIGTGLPNTFSGGMTISAGTVALNTNTALGGAAGTAGAVTVNGGTLRCSNLTALTNTHAITIGASGGTFNIAGVAGTGQNSRVIFATANTLVGSGALTVTGKGNPLQTQFGGAGVLVLSLNNSYTGALTTQDGGLVEAGNANAISSGGTFVLGNNGGLAVGTGAGITLARNVSVTGTGSNLCFINGIGNTLSGNLALGANDLTIGLRDWYNYSTVRNGTISGQITGSGALTVKSGYGSGGVLTLSGNNAGYSGQIAVNNSQLTLNGNNGSLASDAKIALNSSTFNYQGATAGSTLDASSYTLTGRGDRNYTSTYGTSGNSSLNFASLAARTAGDTSNYASTGGANGTTNKITFTAAPTTGVLLDKGVYFNGNNYATYDTGGFLRAYSHGSDANGVTAPAGVTFGVVTASSNVDVTGAISAQTTEQINTLRVGTTNGVAMAASQTLTVDGILKSGGNAATISGGSGIQASSSGELVVRSDASGDTLTISTPILNNVTSSLTKTGAGTLALNATNAYTGGTTINAGLVTFNNNTSFGTQAITLNGGSLRNTASVTTTNNITVNGAVTLDVNTGNWNLNGNISGAGTIIRGTNATLTLYLGGDNSGFTGTFFDPTSGNAVVRFSAASAGSESAKWVINQATGGRASFDYAGGGTIKFGSMTGTGLINSAAAGQTLEVGNLGLNETWGGVINQGGPGTLGVTKVGTGTWTLTGANTWTLGTAINAGTLELANAAALNTTTGAITFGGGTLKYATGITGGITTDYSARIAAGPSASAVKIDTGGNDVTFATALTASQTGGLTKSGDGTLTLTAANAYTGDTTVNAGTLAVNGNAIADTNKLVINGGKVGATGTEVVGTLYFGVTQQVSGTWGSTASGAAHQDDTHFSGTGIVSVTTGPSAGYTTWADANGASGQTKDQDHDNDGVKNGIEYFMGQTGSTFTANPAAINGTVTWPMGATYTGVYGTDYEVQSSTDLVTWTQVPVGTGDNTVSVTAGTSVVYEMPTGGKSFVRLVVKN